MRAAIAASAARPQLGDRQLFAAQLFDQLARYAHRMRILAGLGQLVELGG